MVIQEKIRGKFQWIKFNKGIDCAFFWEPFGCQILCGMMFYSVWGFCFCFEARILQEMSRNGHVFDSLRCYCYVLVCVYPPNKCYTLYKIEFLKLFPRQDTIIHLSKDVNWRQLKLLFCCSTCSTFSTCSEWGSACWLRCLLHLSCLLKV